MEESRFIFDLGYILGIALIWTHPEADQETKVHMQEVYLKDDPRKHCEMRLGETGWGSIQYQVCYYTSFLLCINNFQESYSWYRTSFSELFHM